MYRVKVNGNFEKFNRQVDTEKDEILFDGHKVLYKEFTYIMLNKPKDCISSTFDSKLKTVLICYQVLIQIWNFLPGREGLILIQPVF